MTKYPIESGYFIFAEKAGQPSWWESCRFEDIKRQFWDAGNGKYQSWAFSFNFPWNITKKVWRKGSLLQKQNWISVQRGDFSSGWLNDQIINTFIVLLSADKTDTILCQSIVANLSQTLERHHTQGCEKDFDPIQPSWESLGFNLYRYVGSKLFCSWPTVQYHESEQKYWFPGCNHFEKKIQQRRFFKNWCVGL